MPTNLFTAFQDFDDSVSQQVKQYSGLLGLPVASKTVEVPNRNGYVYVRLRDNTSEIVQAYNEKVSPVYNLPVIIERQGNRWIVVNRDIERYENWGSYSAFLPAHAHQHEFDRDNPGGDIVFSYVDQFMPLNVYPSGTPGSSNVVMGGYSFKKTDGSWAYVGNTGTNSLLIYRPTDNQARMVLVYLDKATGNPGILVNSGTSFAASLTGTNDVLQYLPANASTLEPAKAVRLVSGTTYIGWDNLYDVRQFFGGASSTGTGGGIEEAPIDGLLYGRKNAGWAEVSGTGGAGTPAGSDTQVQYNAGGAFGASTRFIFDYNNGVLVVGDGTTPPITGANELHLIAEDSSPSIGLWAASNSSTINPFIKGVRYRGSFASPLALDQFDEILQIRAAGYNGTNLTATQAEILVDVPYTWVSGSHPTEMGFWVTASGTATLENIFKVRSDGINLASGKQIKINETAIVSAKQQVFGSGENTRCPGSTTQYLSPQLAGGLQTSASQLTTSIAVTITSMAFVLADAQPGTGSLVITLLKNGSDTALTITVAAGAAAATVTGTGSVSYAAGDSFGYKVTNNASTDAPRMRGCVCVLEY